MDPVQLRRRLLECYGIRVEEEMSAYLLRRLTDPESRAIPVIGGDARTGVPVRRVIDRAELALDQPRSASGA